MVRGNTMDDLAPGTRVWVPYAFTDVEAEVDHVYGPPARPHVLVWLTPELSGERWCPSPRRSACPWRSSSQRLQLRERPFATRSRRWAAGWPSSPSRRLADRPAWRSAPSRGGHEGGCAPPDPVEGDARRRPIVHGSLVWFPKTPRGPCCPQGRQAPGVSFSLGLLDAVRTRLPISARQPLELAACDSAWSGATPRARSAPVDELDEPLEGALADPPGDVEVTSPPRWCSARTTACSCDARSASTSAKRGRRC
jgi:hypothetical protein